MQRYVSLILLVGALSQAQKVSGGYDKTINFSGYKTCVFSSTNGARNPLINEMILAALERELSARGLTKVDSTPTCASHIWQPLGYNLQVGEVKFGYNVNPMYVGLVPTGSPATWDVVTGTLVIVFFDNKTDRAVFRGSVKDVLQRAPSAFQRRTRRWSRKGSTTQLQKSSRSIRRHRQLPAET